MPLFALKIIDLDKINAVFLMHKICMLLVAITISFNSLFCQKIERLILKGNRSIEIGKSKDVVQEKRDNAINKAISYYERVLEIEPEHFDALCCLGAIYYTKATDILKQTKVLGPPERSYDAEIKMIEMWFKKALPYFEKAHSINQKDETIIQYLITTYHKLGLFEQKKIAEIVLADESAYKIVPVSDLENLIYEDKK